MVSVNYILSDMPDSGTGLVNHRISIDTFVPNRNKTTNAIPPNKSPTIINQDVKYETVREEFNDYAVGNSIVVSAKAVLGQIRKTDSYNQVGEPIYDLNVQPIIKIVDKRGPV